MLNRAQVYRFLIGSFPLHAVVPGNASLNEAVQEQHKLPSTLPNLECREREREVCACPTTPQDRNHLPIGGHEISQGASD